jgi:hypothetical protein
MPRSVLPRPHEPLQQFEQARRMPYQGPVTEPYCSAYNTEPISSMMSPVRLVTSETCDQNSPYLSGERLPRYLATRRCRGPLSLPEWRDLRRLLRSRSPGRCRRPDRGAPDALPLHGLRFRQLLVPSRVVASVHPAVLAPARSGTTLVRARDPRNGTRPDVRHDRYRRVQGAVPPPRRGRCTAREKSFRARVETVVLPRCSMTPLRRRWSGSDNRGRVRYHKAFVDLADNARPRRGRGARIRP